MPDTTKPIEISANAPIIDLLTAAGRYAVVIATSVPILISLLGDRDFLSIVAYFRSADGSAVIAAAGGLATLAYGLWKTRWRAQQMTTTAADPRVPDAVASIKE